MNKRRKENLNPGFMKWSVAHFHLLNIRWRGSHCNYLVQNVVMELRRGQAMMRHVPLEDGHVPLEDGHVPLEDGHVPLEDGHASFGL